MDNYVNSDKKILCVEDNLLIQKQYVKFFENMNYQVDFASDGFEALLKIANNPPDLILLDIGLPEMNGPAVARRVRNQLHNNKSYIIALRTFGRELEMVCTVNGVDLVVQKPTSYDGLVNVINKWLSIKEISNICH